MENLVKMFDDYAKEKGFGPRIYFVPDVGFATYHLSENECYIDEIYVVPEKRRTNEAAKMADAIVIMAKERGIKLLTGSVCLNANGKENSMKVLLAYGFSPRATNGSLVYFGKEI